MLETPSSPSFSRRKLRNAALVATIAAGIAGAANHTRQFVSGLMEDLKSNSPSVASFDQDSVRSEVVANNDSRSHIRLAVESNNTPSPREWLESLEKNMIPPSLRTEGNTVVQTAYLDPVLQDDQEPGRAYIENLEAEQTAGFVRLSDSVEQDVDTEDSEEPAIIRLEDLKPSNQQPSEQEPDSIFGQEDFGVWKRAG